MLKVVFLYMRSFRTGEDVYTEHPVWEVAARGLEYTVLWKQHCREGRHINIGELRAYLKAERLEASKGGDVRVPIGGDSQVAAGAICKGRSASMALNRELVKSLPYVLGLGIYSSPGYVRSAITHLMILPEVFYSVTLMLFCLTGGWMLVGTIILLLMTSWSIAVWVTTLWLVFPLSLSCI